MLFNVPKTVFQQADHVASVIKAIGPRSHYRSVYKVAELIEYYTRAKEPTLTEKRKGLIETLEALPGLLTVLAKRARSVEKKKAYERTCAAVELLSSPIVEELRWMTLEKQKVSNFFRELQPLLLRLTPDIVPSYEVLDSENPLGAAFLIWEEIIPLQAPPAHLYVSLRSELEKLLMLLNERFSEDESGVFSGAPLTVYKNPEIFLRLRERFNELLLELELQEITASI